MKSPGRWLPNWVGSWVKALPGATRTGTSPARSGTVLQTIPGVVVDRVNVGGAESGQQSIYVAKGASSGENTWTLDGVVITDMASLFANLHWDFYQFQEVRITPAGTRRAEPDHRAGTNGWSCSPCRTE